MSCPKCGYCDKCGRSNPTYPTYPYYTLPPSVWQCMTCRAWVVGTYHTCFSYNSFATIYTGDVTNTSANEPKSIA